MKYKKVSNPKNHSLIKVMKMFMKMNFKICIQANKVCIFMRYLMTRFRL